MPAPTTTAYALHTPPTRPPHPADASLLGKPLIIEEFGTQRAGRDSYFSAAFQAVEASLRAGGPLKGALFWQFYAPGQVGQRGRQPGFIAWGAQVKGWCSTLPLKQDRSQPGSLRPPVCAPTPLVCRPPAPARAAAQASLASTLPTPPSSWSRPTLPRCSSWQGDRLWDSAAPRAPQRHRPVQTRGERCSKARCHLPMGAVGRFRACTGRWLHSSMDVVVVCRPPGAEPALPPPQPPYAPATKARPATLMWTSACAALRAARPPRSASTPRQVATFMPCC